MASTDKAVDLAALDARLSRIEATLDRLTGWMDQVPAFTSAAADSIDAFAREQGDVDQRVNAAMALMDRLTNPETAMALDRVLAVSGGLAEVAEYTAGVPAVAAIAVDSADEYLRSLGDLDKRAPAALAMLEKLTAPETSAALTRVLEVSGKLAEVAEYTAGVPAVAAIAVDSVDEVVRSIPDMNARVPAALALVERITAPETMATLGRLLSISDQLAEVAEYAAGAPAVAAIAVDSADELARQLAESGADASQRLEAVTQLLLRLTAPESTHALGELLDRIDTWESALGYADMLPGFLSMAVDTFDEVNREYMAKGVGPEELIQLWQTRGLQAIKLLNSEQMQRFLSFDFQGFFDFLASDKFQALVESDIFSPAAVEVVSASANALHEARSQPVEAVGAFGAFRSLSDPEVQRAVGFGIAFARAFGQALNNPSTLPAPR